MARLPIAYPAHQPPVNSSTYARGAQLAIKARWRTTLESEAHVDVMQPIAYDILAYLFKNPEAQDTLEGIAGWWLSETTVKPVMADVAEALAELVDRGLVIARSGNNSQTFYKVSRHRMEEISALLIPFENSDETNELS